MNTEKGKMETLHHRRWLTGIIAWFVFIQAWGQLQTVNFGWGIATVLVLSVAAMLLIPKLCYSRMEWYIIGAGVAVGVVGWWEGNHVGLPWGAYCFASLVGSWLLVGKLGCSLDNVQQVASDLALVSRVRDVQDSEQGVFGAEEDGCGLEIEPPINP